MIVWLVIWLGLVALFNVGLYKTMTEMGVEVEKIGGYEASFGFFELGLFGLGNCFCILGFFIPPFFARVLLDLGALDGLKWMFGVGKS